MSRAAMEISPGGRIRGEASVPASKSEAQRAILCAGLARGRTEIRMPESGDDVSGAVRLLEASGVSVVCGSGLAVIRPEGPWAARGPVSAGESGTLARLATAAFAFGPPAGRTTEIGAEGTLLARRSAPLFDALERAGARIECLGARGGWPVRVTATEPPPELEVVEPVSSQEISALLVAAAACGPEIRVTVRGPIPSRPYVRMTERVLERFGARVRGEFVVRGPLAAPEEAIEIEPDASAAAVVLAAACLSGGSVSVSGLGPGSLQGDVRIVEHLASFGCRAWSDARGLHAEGEPVRGAELDLSGEPDLAPVLAAVAAGAAIRAGSASRLGGLATLRRKESDRLEVLVRGLGAVGVDARIEADALAVGPGRWRGGEVLLDPRGDHRMVFAFALLGLLGEGVAVLDPGCVDKSWPSFWATLASLGAELQPSPS